MRNPGVVVGFLLGVAFTLLLDRIVTQSAWAQTLIVDARGAVPVVPTRPLVKANVDASGPGYALKVDGIDCVDCKVENGAVVQYGGGAFKFTNFQRSGATTLELKGAALNTKILLSSFGLMGCPVPQPKQRPTDPNVAILKAANTKLETIDLLFSPLAEK